MLPTEFFGIPILHKEPSTAIGRIENLRSSSPSSSIAEIQTLPEGVKNNLQIIPRKSAKGHILSSIAYTLLPLIWRQFSCDMTFVITHQENGSTTVNRTDDSDCWFGTFSFRMNYPTRETVSSANDTTYRYMGAEDEKVPRGTTIVIIDPSVKVIRAWAFFGCTRMKICSMHDEVEAIETGAFFNCEAMETIRLSKTLKRIENGAFCDCKSLDALFIPSSVEKIDHFAFWNCTNTRILSLPENIGIDHIGSTIFGGCNKFLRIARIRGYESRGGLRVDNDVTDFFQRLSETLLPITQIESSEGYYVPMDTFTQTLFDALSHCMRYEQNPPIDNNDQVHQAIIGYCRDLPPLHKVCLDTNVTAQKIHDCIRTHGKATALTKAYGGMTPLHTLASNPHATPGSILACFHLNMNAAFAKDDDAEMTPVDYLWKYENVDCLIPLIQALCLHREAHSLEASDHIYIDHRSKGKKQRAS